MAKVILLIAALSAACQPQRPQTPPSPAAERPWRPLAKTYSAELLVDDQPLGPELGLSESDVPDSTIERLMAHRFALPSKVTIAVLHLPGSRARRPWFLSTETNDMTQALADTILAALSRSPRVSRVATLPLIVLGEDRNVATLRGAAARLQADVVLVYRPNCRLYERTPFIGSTQYRAVCTTEAVLLDTRSGVIPFSRIVSRESVTQRQRDDFETSGTWARVQLAAVLQSLLKVSEDASAFVAAAPH